MDALGVYVHARHFCFWPGSILDSQQHDHFYTTIYDHAISRLQT
jgi:hypothetical protein